MTRKRASGGPPQPQSRAAAPVRRRLPDTRAAVTRRLSLLALVEGGSVQEIDLYVTVGLYGDGAPGEVFIRADQQGSTVSGFADAVALCMSIGLQYGVPLSAFTSKLQHLRFEPMGRTRDPEQPVASSLLDLLAGWLDRRFGAGGEGGADRA